jgi:hypothetical protein
VKDQTGPDFQALTAQVTSTTTKATTLGHHASVEDVAEPMTVPGPQPHHSSHILEAADGSNDDNDTMGKPEIEKNEAKNEDSSKETESEDDEAELGRSSYTICQNIQLIWQFTACLMKCWDTPVYTFFRPTPTIIYVEGHKVHIFECAVTHCKCKTRLIHHYINTGDISSTGNLHQHAICCWGDETDFFLFVFIFVLYYGMRGSRHLSSYFPWHHFHFIYYFIVRLRYI